MCSSTPEVGQEAQEFKAPPSPPGYIGDLRLFCNKREPVSENQTLQ